MNEKLSMGALTAYGNGNSVKLLAYWCDGYRLFIKVLLNVGWCKSDFIMISL